MHSKSFQPNDGDPTALNGVTHPQDQISAERVLGIVLWSALVAVLLTIGL